MMTFEDLMFIWRLFKEPKIKEENYIEEFSNFLQANKDIVSDYIQKGENK